MPKTRLSYDDGEDINEWLRSSGYLDDELDDDEDYDDEDYEELDDEEYEDDDYDDDVEDIDYDDIDYDDELDEDDEYLDIDYGDDDDDIDYEDDEDYEDEDYDDDVDYDDENDELDDWLASDEDYDDEDEDTSLPNIFTPDDEDDEDYDELDDEYDDVEYDDDYDNIDDVDDTDTLRNENYRLQTRINQLEQELETLREQTLQYVEEGVTEFLDEFAKNIGIGEDVDYDDYATYISNQLQEKQTRATSAIKELAVARASIPYGVDPARLVDSKQFNAGLDALDVSSPNYQTAVNQLVAMAVQTSPWLKDTTTGALRSGSADFSNGTLSTSVETLDVAALAKRRRERRQ